MRHGYDRNKFHSLVESKEKRKLKADRSNPFSILYCLRLFGAVGWIVAIPTVIGISLGIWIDTAWPGLRSWTLMFLVFGLAFGCSSAWFWLTRQRNKILKERNDES